MARKRMIDPGIWQSEDFSKLSTLAKLVFVGMFSNADDEGRGRARAVYLKSALFPYDETMRATDIEKTLKEIASYMSVIFYAFDNSEYYQLTNWDLWQKVDRPTPSKIPAFDESSTRVRRLFDEGSLLIEKNKNRIEKNRTEVLLSGAKAPDRQAADNERTEEVPFIELPLNDNTLYPVYSDYVDELKKLYPAVDVEQEFRNMRGWIDSNPKKRKTKSGIKQFITRWLSKEQNRGGVKGGPIDQEPNTDSYWDCNGNVL